MAFTSDMLFHWLRKSFPSATYTPPISGKRSVFSRAMFWAGPREMEGHLVIVNGSQTRHIAQAFPKTVFLCVGCGESCLVGTGNEYISIPDVRALDKVFNLVGEILDTLSAWQSALDAAAHRDMSYEAIIASCDEVLDAPMALLDSDFRYVGYSKHLAAENGYEERYVDRKRQLSVDTINQLIAQPGFERLESERGVFSYDFVENMLHRNIFWNDRYVGRLVLPHGGDEAEAAYHIAMLNTVGDKIEELYARLGTFWPRVRDDGSLKQRLKELLEGTDVRFEDFRAQMASQAFADGDDFVLIQLRPQTANSDGQVEVLLNGFESKWPQCLCASTQKGDFMLADLSRFQRETGRDFSQELIVFLREGLLSAGMSRSFRDYKDLGAALRQSDIAFEMGHLLDPMQWCFRFDDYAFRYLLEKGSSGFEARHVIAPALLVLADYDAANGTELLASLRCYLENGGNAVATAKALFVSRSTLLKRLERIRLLTRLDLSDFDERLYVALSLRLADSDVRTKG